jgi:hypothetical protein
MVTVTERVARAVRQNSLRARCFLCVSLQLGLVEKNMWDKTQVLILRDEFRIVRRACDVCSRVEDMLVRVKDLAFDTSRPGQ